VAQRRDDEACMEDDDTDGGWSVEGAARRTPRSVHCAEEVHCIKSNIGLRSELVALTSNKFQMCLVSKTLN